MLTLAMAYRLFIILSFLAIFVSGINYKTIVFSILFSLLATSFGLMEILKRKRRLNFPKHFGLMVMFVIILNLYPIFIKDKINPIYFAAIFGEGLLYWLIFFNIKNGGNLFRSLLIKLTLLYSLFYVLTRFSNLNLTTFSAYFFQEGLPSKHYHIGDLWAFTLTLIVGLGWGKFKLKDWLIMDLGILFLVISNARSAYLSLLLGFAYIATKRWGKAKINRYLPIIFFFSTIGLFMFASSSKTTLFSRPYFLQSITSFPTHPLGVGFGNFKLINEYILKTTLAKEVSLSSYVHNIFLEALSGVGIFSVLFLIFLIQVAKDLWQASSEKVVWGALLTAILINFMFDTTYTIPSLIWILFICLGVFQASKSQPKET
jgi:hypothetical protein